MSGPRLEEVQRDLREIRELAPDVFDEFYWAWGMAHWPPGASRDRIARTSVGDPTGNVVMSKAAMQDNLRKAASDVSEALSRLRTAFDTVARSLERNDPHACPRCKGRRYIEGQICDKCRGAGDRLDAAELDDAQRTQDYLTRRDERVQLLEAQGRRRARGEHIPS